MLKKEAEITQPFNTIMKVYPDGTVFMKRLKFTCYAKEKGWELSDRKEETYDTNDYEYIQEETYSSVVNDYRQEQYKRLREVQDAICGTSIPEITQAPIIPIEPISIDPEVLEQRRNQKILYNISKTRNKIFDIARSNDFNYFITLTYSSEKCDRYSFSECSAKVRVFMNNFRRLHSEDCPNFKYLLVHEQHLDGAYHYHGLVYIENTDLLIYDDVRSKQYEKKHHGKKLDIFNWTNWKNGFSTVSKIENVEACRKYILKYISKNIEEDYQKGQRHFYYSQNCIKPITGALLVDKISDDFVQIYDTDRSTGYEMNLNDCEV